MKYGLFSGILWGLDTVVLGIALSMSPYIGTAEAIAFAAIASSFLHDAGCALHARGGAKPDRGHLEGAQNK